MTWSWASELLISGLAVSLHHTLVESWTFIEGSSSLAVRFVDVVLAWSWTSRPRIYLRSIHLLHSGRWWNENTLVLKFDSVIVIAILSRSWALLVETAVEDVSRTLSAAFTKHDALSFGLDSFNILGILPRGWSLLLRQG